MSMHELFRVNGVFPAYYAGDPEFSLEKITGQLQSFMPVAKLSWPIVI